MLRNTDVFVIVVDLSMDAVAQVREVTASLREWDFRMLPKGHRPTDGNPWLDKATILVGNKADIPGALDQYLELEEAFADRYPVVMASAEEDIGFDDLALEIFEALKVIRVYTKSPRVKLEDYEPSEPLVLPTGATVIQAATQLHKDLGQGLKYAVLWGESSKFNGQHVGRTHQLIDRDIIELHT